MKNIIIVLLSFLCFLVSCTESKYDFSSEDGLFKSLCDQAEKEGLDISTVSKAIDAYFDALDEELSSELDALEADVVENLNKIMSEELELTTALSKAESSEEIKVLEEKLNELNLRSEKEIEAFDAKCQAKFLALCKKKFNNRNLKDILNF